MPSLKQSLLFSFETRWVSTSKQSITFHHHIIVAKLPIKSLPKYTQSSMSEITILNVTWNLKFCKLVFNFLIFTIIETFEIFNRNNKKHSIDYLNFCFLGNLKNKRRSFVIRQKEENFQSVGNHLLHFHLQ